MLTLELTSNRMLSSLPAAAATAVAQRSEGGKQAKRIPLVNCTQKKRPSRNACASVHNSTSVHSVCTAVELNPNTVQCAAGVGGAREYCLRPVCFSLTYGRFHKSEFESLIVKQEQPTLARAFCSTLVKHSWRCSPSPRCCCPQRWPCRPTSLCPAARTVRVIQHDCSSGLPPATIPVVAPSMYQIYGPPPYPYGP